ncbi:MAG: hypothetical protein JW862_10645 [Anaerolineales bacterium]|nr:hypothetical protein [Anaerolineales bacterium]
MATTNNTTIRRSDQTDRHEVRFTIDERAKGLFFRPDSFHQIDLSMIDDQGFVEKSSLTRSWMSPKLRRVVPGFVRFYQGGRHLTKYTFGGYLHFSEDHEDNYYNLKSSAPILELTKYHRIPDILADETEILFAKLQSTSILEIEEIQQILAQIPPFKLFCACLEFFDLHLEVLNSAEEMLHLEAFRDYIKARISDLKAEQLWPVNLPNLWTVCLADPVILQPDTASEQTD